MRAYAIAFLVVLLLSSTAHAQAPEITGHTVTSMRSVDFVFSDLMNRDSVEAPGNMAIYPTGSPDDTLETWTVHLDGDGVTMHLYLIEPMTDGASYTLALNGVRNTSGDYVQEGFEYTFTATDLVPPALLSVSFLASGQIDLVFTEDIVETEGEDVSNYGLFETATPGNTIEISGSRMRGIYDRVNFELGQDLIPGTEYTIIAANLHDLSGNPLPGGSELLFTYTGTNSRSLMGLYADFERLTTAVSGTGTYSFDMWAWVKPREEGATGILFRINYPSNVTYQPSEINPDHRTFVGDIYNGLGVMFDDCQYDWTWIFKQTITVIDGQPSLVSIYPWEDLSTKNTYIFECAWERRQFPMDITSSIEINAPDARPLAIIASFSGYTTIDIVFSIPMDQFSAETISNFEIFETASPGNTVGISSAALQADGLTVRLVSAVDLSAGVEYTARMTGLESAAGISIYPGSEISFTAIDEEGPDLVSASRTGQHTADIVFDEPVDQHTANSVLNYEIVKSHNLDFNLDLNSAALQEDGVTVRLTINSPMEDGTQYKVLASNVEDLRGNRMLSLRSVEFVADDIYPPYIVNISSLPDNCIRIHFSETVDSASAVNPDNYWLRSPYSSAGFPLTSLVWDGDEVLLTTSVDLTLANTYLAYLLLIQYIEDLSGNSIPEWESTNFTYLLEIPEPLVGLWADSNRNINSIRVYPYETFEFRIWCRPGPSGMFVLNYALQNTSLQNLEYYIIGVEYHPDFSVNIGDVFSGNSPAMSKCMTDWFWIVKFTCILIDGRGYIDLIPHPIEGGPNVVVCTGHRPYTNCGIASRLFINEWLIGTLLETSSVKYNGSGIEVSWTMQELDEEIDFIISRKKAGEPGFAALESVSLAIDGMSYTFVDNEVENGTSYIYRVEYPENGEIHTLFETEEVGIPQLALALDQNWPNPFNPSTSIGYYLPESCDVRLEIYDASGRLVDVLQDGAQASGKYNIEWNGTNSIGSRVSSGIYFYRLTAGKESISKKMVLLR